MKKSSSVSNSRSLTPRAVKKFRKEQGWSAEDLGHEMGLGIDSQSYTRSYIKSIEGGSLPITERFAARFFLLRESVMGGRVHAKQITSPFFLPRSFEILARPKKCRVCGKWKVFRVPWQKDCKSH